MQQAVMIPAGWSMIAHYPAHSTEAAIYGGHTLLFNSLHAHHDCIDVCLVYGLHIA